MQKINLSAPSNRINNSNVLLARSNSTSALHKGLYLNFILIPNSFLTFFKKSSNSVKWRMLPSLFITKLSFAFIFTLLQKIVQDLFFTVRHQVYNIDVRHAPVEYIHDKHYIFDTADPTGVAVPKIESLTSNVFAITTTCLSLAKLSMLYFTHAKKFANNKLFQLSRVHFARLCGKNILRSRIQLIFQQKNTGRFVEAFISIRRKVDQSVIIAMQLFILHCEKIRDRLFDMDDLFYFKQVKQFSNSMIWCPSVYGLQSGNLLSANSNK